MVAAILSYYQPCHDEGHNATQEGKSSPLRKRIKYDNKISDLYVYLFYFISSACYSAMNNN